MKLLGNYCCSTGIQTSITVGVVGMFLMYFNFSATPQL